MSLWCYRLRQGFFRPHYLLSVVGYGVFVIELASGSRALSLGEFLDIYNNVLIGAEEVISKLFVWYEREM